jgi:hypothetical protein
MEGSGCGWFKAVSRRLFSGIEKNHEKPVSFAGLRAEIGSQDLTSDGVLIDVRYKISWLKLYKKQLLFDLRMIRNS